MNREEALVLVKEKVSNQNLIKHMIAVGAIMRGLARKLGEDENLWEVVGILHDIDYEETKDNWKEHALKSAKMLEGKLPEEALYAIKAHNFENTGVMPKREMDYALIASDALSGLIVASALVMPSKKLEEVKVKTLMRKFKSKDFARKVSRENILYCEKLGLSLQEFLEIGLNAMKEVSEELGL
ncbi:MAG: HDIG domain-containing protein [Nanoarchaeota archaeon]|nr:HDIG domain-containing protein [Nanoarchaeota archaeon]